MGYETNPADMEALASRLRSGSSSLEAGAGAPPPPVDAGTVTGAVNGLLGAFGASLAGVVEGVGAAGDAVVTSKDSYDTAEQNTPDQMPTAGPH